MTFRREYIYHIKYDIPGRCWEVIAKFNGVQPGALGLYSFTEFFIDDHQLSDVQPGHWEPSIDFHKKLQEEGAFEVKELGPISDFPEYML